MNPLSIDEWSEALVPLWKEYYLTEEEVNLRENDLLPPLLQFLELLRECRQNDGFLAQVLFVRPSRETDLPVVQSCE